MAKGGYVYLIANKKRSTLYTGVTSNLQARIYDHKHGTGSSFSKKYRCRYLMYYEFFPDVESAIKREKQLKKWKRSYKENLINAINPGWLDLYDQVLDFQ